jgi:hypothetical protein
MGATNHAFDFAEVLPAEELEDLLHDPQTQAHVISKLDK